MIVRGGKGEGERGDDRKGGGEEETVYIALPVKLRSRSRQVQRQITGIGCVSLSQ